MLSHDERLETARAAVDYITGRSASEQQCPVTNCPGWTVYNAASHVGRVAIAWEEMITSTPDDADSRRRGYERSGLQPEGTAMSTLRSWAHSALNRLADDVHRQCYFSMTGGEGTVALWTWHAASELGLHRLDVEAALGQEHSMTARHALDAATYTCEFFLPAMRRALGQDPGALTVRLESDDGRVGVATIGSATLNSATVEGPAVDVLLALWGRPHVDVRVTDGDPVVWEGWQSMPGKAFQFGTWD